MAITKPGLKFVNILFPAQNAMVLVFHLFLYHYLEHILYLILVRFQNCSMPACSILCPKKAILGGKKTPTLSWVLGVEIAPSVLGVKHIGCDGRDSISCCPHTMCRRTTGEGDLPRFPDHRWLCPCPLGWQGSWDSFLLVHRTGTPGQTTRRKGQRNPRQLHRASR